MTDRVAVLGAGAWGTAVAAHLARRDDLQVTLWARDPQAARAMAAGRANALVSKDILVRTPDQFRSAESQPFGVMDEVINHGMTIYER